jgi:hypothetical protein
MVKICEYYCMGELKTAALFSDFDGTVVEKLSNKYPWRWPQNMAKYPLRRIEGWADFINGAISVPGVHYEGLVSRRGRYRKTVTALSLARTGLDQDFDRMILAGSEVMKARVIAESAEDLAGISTIGMVEDRPDKLIPALFELFDTKRLYPDSDLAVPRVTIGVVNHSRAQARIRATLNALEKIEETDRDWDGFYYGTQKEIDNNGTLTVASEKMRIEVAELPPYSFDAGAEFGERLVS